MEEQQMYLEEREKWPISIYRDLLIDLLERVRFDMEMGVTDYALEMGYDLNLDEILNLQIHPENPITLESIRTLVKNCKNCKLHQTRENVVFGEGNSKTDIMFIGEGPGKDEDLSGLPFVGKAGQLLNKILISINLNRDDVYIANIIKCRPPNNRVPESDEIKSCFEYLECQVEIIKPKFIVCLGLTAAQALLNTKTSISMLRGKFHAYKDIKVLVTYHPAALLRNERLKRPVWEDMKMLMAEYKKKN